MLSEKDNFKLNFGGGVGAVISILGVIALCAVVEGGPPNKSGIWLSLLIPTAAWVGGTTGNYAWNRLGKIFTGNDPETPWQSNPHNNPDDKERLSDA
jgi:hypothetical protein